MNQGIDISIPKLSAPVELLDINRRACQALRRAGIYTVAEIVLAGIPKLSAVKNVGHLTTSRIFRAAASYLGLPEDGLADEAGSVLGTCWNPWEAPTRALPLPDPILRELRRKGYFQVRQLIQARTTGYGTALWLSAKDCDEVDRALNEYLGRAARDRLVRWFGTEDIPELTPIPCPVLSLPLPKLGEGPWSALKQTSLQRSASGTTVTRRINAHQLSPSLQQAYDHVRQNLNVLSIFLDYFEDKLSPVQASLQSSPLELETLIEHLLPDPAVSDLILDEQDVERMIVLLRSLVSHPGPLLEEMKRRWPVLLLLSWLVEPALEKLSTPIPASPHSTNTNGGRRTGSIYDNSNSSLICDLQMGEVGGGHA